MGARRMTDIMLASAGLVLLAPVMAIIGGSIRLFDGAPILFRQVRVTKGGRLFTVLKFRTMNDRRDAQGQLLPDEMRTTALGRFLRRSRLDELPQLWNILLGEMSLIGPRPLLPQTIAASEEKGHLRCAVRPGLTGWAQVNGATLLSDEDKIALDLWYIENRSLWIDLVIIAGTVGVALRGERFNLRLKGRAHEGHTPKCG